MEKRICPICNSEKVAIAPFSGLGDFAICFNCGASGNLSKPDEWKPFHDDEIHPERRADDGHKRAD